MVDKRVKKYWLVWKRLVENSLQESLSNKFTSTLFIIAKLIRFGIFLAFILSLTQPGNALVGYTQKELTIYFLMFNIFDLIGQLFFRGIYMFKPEILSGEFDFKLVKPIDSLFLVLARRFDVLDVPLLLVCLVLLYFAAWPINSAFLFYLLIASCISITLITSIHVFVAALYVRFVSVDYVINIYRFTSVMARFPVNLYADSVRYVLTMIIPIAIIFNLPAEVLLGLISSTNLFKLVIISLMCMVFVRWYWTNSLKKYASASS